MTNTFLENIFDKNLENLTKMSFFLRKMCVLMNLRSLRLIFLNFKNIKNCQILKNSSSQLHSRQKSGYVFLDNVAIVKHKDERSKPEDHFKQEDFPDFVPGKFVHREFYPLNEDDHLSLDIFLEKISLERQNNSADKRINKDLKNRSAVIS